MGNANKAKVINAQGRKLENVAGLARTSAQAAAIARAQVSALAEFFGLEEVRTKVEGGVQVRYRQRLPRGLGWLRRLGLFR